jgi:hypothetical protein
LLAPATRSCSQNENSSTAANGDATMAISIHSISLNVIRCLVIDFPTKKLGIVILSNKITQNIPNVGIIFFPSSAKLSKICYGMPLLKMDGKNSFHAIF